MKRPPSLTKSLSGVLGDASGCAGRFLWAESNSVSLSDLLHGTSLGGRAGELSGRSVLLLAHDQLAAALAIIELDGVAERLIICPPDLSAEYLPELIVKSGVDAIVTDYAPHGIESLGIPLCVQVSSALEPTGRPEFAYCETEWVLLTSGTTGAPKMLAHSFATLTGAIKAGPHSGADVVWGTFYDIRRYGGMQIFLRALLGNGSLVLSGTGESPGDHLLRLAAHSVTHLTGTPTHWRRALMSPAVRTIAPRYVRLSGEIADQAILNTLRAFFPSAAIGHAFASTEAGVGFEVNDGLEGFPVSVLSTTGEVEIKVEDRSLRIRSRRTASRYVGEQDMPLMDNDGFVDTGDIVELRDDRYYFLGRRTGMINVGGQKVYPEEIEARLNRHPAVRMSCVRARPNPIMGSLVVADVVLKTEVQNADGRIKELEREILNFCRDTLPRHKVPAKLSFVPALSMAATGKLIRNNA